ncbi:OsmC family protein [Elioraea sp. Yellowstone]|jgi:uncharacterized OsmC-like protein|uniref:OsmC family protein n=1 Tax=Elioraea sp. Yellowstone TaxID=2592070 RepID=UPI0011547BEB|nr:OsmC family protein [Elioraea sp. Yellowstone]TQF82493.1 OsmC family protein [Elioraea sp. Yellowstone]
MNATTQAVEAPAKKTAVPMNGVDTPALFATIGVVADQPALAKFQFRANGTWLNGTHMQTTMSGFFGAGGEHVHKQPYVADADHPAVLVGADNGPTPVEWLLHAIAACLTAGIANIAAARGVKLTSVESSVEGDIDLRGILGLSDEVRNGFSGIRVTFRIAGDASAETLKKIVEQSRARSAVFDVLTNGTPVAISVEA